jgi:subtilisin-like proprotein convertase family protein
MTTKLVMTMAIAQAAERARRAELVREAMSRRAIAQEPRTSTGRVRWPRRRVVVAAAAIVALLAALTFASGSAFATSGTYTNPTPIGIPIQGTATPYPSPIYVSGMPGPVDRLVVSLQGVTHTHPGDLDVLLVSPSGRKSIVMSDACGSPDVTNRTWVFPSTGNAENMSDTAYCESGVYRATDYGDFNTDVWPGAPGGALTDFTRLNGVDPNGTWNLYVSDDSANNLGTIQGGWSLGIDSTPPDVFIPASGTTGPANPYPVTGNVTGRDGVITDVNVALTGVYHRRPDDLDMLLVGPHGERVVLMSDACGDTDLEFRYWTWDDEATRAMPDGGIGDVCPSYSVRRPTDYEPGEQMPAPAPPGPYSASLSAFDGTDPNGQWRLFINDDSFGEIGWLANKGAPAFTLLPTTRPEARVSFREGAVALTEGEKAELTLTRGGAPDLGPGSVTVTSAPASATSGADFKPVATTVEFARGQTEKTVPVETLADSVAEGDETFSLAIGQASGDAQAAPPASATVTVRDRSAVRSSADTTAPETTIEKAPRGRTTRATARLRFSSNEAGSSFECKLDKRKWKPCSPPRKLKRLRAGKHRFAVRAIDAAGNVDPSPAKRRWRVVNP